MWFEELTGFLEKSPEQVRKNLYVEGDKLISRINAREFTYGTLEIPCLFELRERVKSLKLPEGKATLSECVSDVQKLHEAPENIGGFFQVASQFNLLEMVSPEVTPDSGIERYQYDLTQGPACAIAAAAGTIYRNYFVNVNGEAGQSASNQVDTLSGVGEILGNNSESLWVMKNGYALASEEGLTTISKKLESMSDEEIDLVKQTLKIGIQWNTEVTLNTLKHTVTQSYCSALPVAYSQYSHESWEAFATLILEASYEATICAAILNCYKTGNHNVYLTLLGGGAFGNKESWIIGAIEKAVTKYQHFDLNVFIVSYGASNVQVQKLVNRYDLANPNKKLQAKAFPQLNQSTFHQ